MRLIDADALIEILIDRDFIKTSRQEDNARELLNLAPTVEERRTGKWIGKPIAGYSTVRCSCCEEVFLENEGKWNYCPNCGADMRGERT